MVYENLFTGERQAWFPDAPAVDPKAGDGDAKKKVGGFAVVSLRKEGCCF